MQKNINEKELLNLSNKEVIKIFNPSNVDLHKSISNNSIQILTDDFLIKDYCLFLSDIDNEGNSINLYSDSKEAIRLITDNSIKNITAFKLINQKPKKHKIISREEFIFGLLFGYKLSFIKSFK